MATTARHTPDELLQFTDDIHRELVDGEIIEVSGPTHAPHGFTLVQIAGRLAARARELGTGVVLANVGFILRVSGDPERVREPDVAFVATSRLSEGGLPEKFIEGAPDLAVEVVSHTERSVDLMRKVREYLECGARAVWVVVPEARAATVYRADGSARLLREDESLDGEELLPGLRIPLGEVFR